MQERHKVSIVLLLGVAVRLGLFQSSSLTSILVDRVELSTPVTSFKRLLEGVYLFDHGINPYDGGVFQQAPVFLALFSSILRLPISNLLVNLLYCATDVAIAQTLVTIALLVSVLDKGRLEAINHKSESESESIGESIGESLTNNSVEGALPSWVVAAISLFNPFSLLSCCARSTAAFNTVAILTSVSYSLRGRAGPAMAALAFATYLSMYPVLLLLPSVLLILDVLRQQTGAEPRKMAALIITAEYILSFAGSLVSSFLFLGSWEFIASVYGTLLTLPDLVPTIGLWWYFFTEIFDTFRNFFLGVFQLHMVVYVVPLCIKIRKSPLFVIGTLCGLAAIFKPYPSVADASLYMCFLSLFPSLFQHMRYTFLISCALSYTVIFGPAFYYLWITTGTGNANFYYAITLVWNLALGALLTDSIFAWLRADWESDNPLDRDRDVRFK